MARDQQRKLMWRVTYLNRVAKAGFFSVAIWNALSDTAICQVISLLLTYRATSVWYV